MRSMTGFGRASRRDRRSDVEVEARSVNHRFLSLKISLPEGFGRYEPDVEQLVRARLARGSVTISATMKSAGTLTTTLPDVPHIKAVYRQLNAIRRSLGIKGDIPFETVLAVPGLFGAANHQSDLAAKLWPSLKKLTEEALEALVTMRQREGASIQKDMLHRLDAIEHHVKRIHDRAPSVLAAYERKLDERINSFFTTKGLDVAKQDLVKEVAVFAERSDISEELQRLEAHIANFRRAVREPGEVGRRLDFLTQEMLRETNTLTSKGNDSEISTHAVEIKAELEKIKEQAENVE